MYLLIIPVRDNMGANNVYCINAPQINLYSYLLNAIKVKYKRRKTLRGLEVVSICSIVQA